MSKQDNIDAIRKQILDKAVQDLGDHFESVVILASSHDGKEGGTFFGFRTHGNKYAADGMAEKYLNLDLDYEKFEADE